MKGDGNGNFTPMKPGESGFFVPYNVKDIEMMNTKQGTLILVTSNNGPLRVFGNSSNPALAANTKH